jgi:large subunit ribosomal protein L30
MVTKATRKKAAPRKKATPRGSGRRPARTKSERTLTVVQVHSGIGCTDRQRQVLRSLGLRGPQHSHSLPDVPSVRGMVAAVPHLVRIAGPAASPRGGGRKA